MCPNINYTREKHGGRPMIWQILSSLEMVTTILGTVMVFVLIGAMR